ncbi:MAG: S8 family serine peptidase [Phycisphaerales bacterium]|nr:S8 family serine peptidase [Phycisphaerales bacterium]
MVNRATLLVGVLALLSVPAFASPRTAGIDAFTAETPILDPSDVVGRAGEFQLSGRVILRPRLGPDGLLVPSRALAQLKGQLISVVESTGEHIVRVPDKETDAGFIRRMRATGEFEFVTPDWLCFPAGSGDPLTPQQWHHTAVQTLEAWPTTEGTGDVIVAIVDSGVDLTHQDLIGRLVLPGHNSVSSSALASAAGPFNDISGTGHGTRCAGIVAAQNNNNLGGSGIAPGVLVLPIRCTNNASGTAFLSDILNGAEWASRNGAQVVSVSYNGVSSPSVGLRGSVLKSFGSLLFFAAGNSGSELSGAADWPDVVIVSALDRADRRYAQSNFGSPIDIAAPGVEILSTMIQNQYTSSTGTSFAVPQAAGVAALLWSIASAVSPDDIQNVLTNSAIDIGAPGEDAEFGAGRLNAARALAMQQGQFLGSLRPTGPLEASRGLVINFFATPSAQTFLPVFDEYVAQSTAIIPTLILGPGFVSPTSDDDHHIAALLTGYFRASESGPYTFALTSAGNARMYLGGTLVINAEGGSDVVNSVSTLSLNAGLHTLRIEYSYSDENSILILQSLAPGQSEFAPIGGAALARDFDRNDSLDIADDAGNPLPRNAAPASVNNGVTESDYNLFFRALFSDDLNFALYADVADDAGLAGPNGRVTEGDYNFFIRRYFE